ncbi:MAG: hypothetical protein HYY40_05245, partial [Bacteroidetes bacterium]|nr:hypothetical protein [Bacteroidota bacterium]
LGIGKVSVTASSGSEKATEEIEIDVRNPNPLVTNITEAVVEPGKSWTTSVTPPGMAGTNKGALEVSTIPPINLGYRLKYLITYPHGCIEQTTSGAFPQLYLADILELNSDFRAKIDRNIKAGIDRLIRSFQTTSGGFAYWPGDHEACDWGSTYAGHFLLEADAKGYNVPAHVISNWKRYQKQLAQSWRPNQKYAYWDHGHYYNDALIQAYRLYTLALARSPELAAMNRLKEMGDMPVVSLAQLAAAYALAGQTETAQKLLSGKSLEVKNYVEMSYTYGSDERDRAIIIKALCLLNEYGKAAPIVKEISQELSNEHSWMGTQTTAWCLMAVSDFAVKGGASDNLGFSYSLNGSGEKKIETKRPIVQIEIPVKTTEAKNVSVTSASSGVLFVRVITEGYPETGDQTAVESNLGLDITYRKMDGTALDVTNLDQGTDFYAEVTISNPGTRGWYKEMALTQIFPSGWEIHNTRMDEGPSAIKSAAPTYRQCMITRSMRGSRGNGLR